jgi:predicted acylesterase/phospholipase RssA
VDDNQEAKWWDYATLSEACFGLDKFEEARQWISKATDPGNAKNWERESTIRQFVALAELKCKTADESLILKIWNCIDQILRILLPRHETDSSPEYYLNIRKALGGKIELALSGGGFRASFFHIGVLAKLAELDLLRHIEVISCVSGGSIIGVHYCLELRKLLQSTPDSKIKQSDYVRIMECVADEFLKAVKKNIRCRVFLNPIKLLKMMVSSEYSRIERLGELYERMIYSRVDDPEKNRKRFLDDLIIHPCGDPGGGGTFNPKHDNWYRAAKVPILIINATTLNTGHNWQFTASWMGEPPSSIDPEIDANPRFRRMYYREAPPQHQHFRLGHAVAASSCVPGIFPPLALKNLYPDKILRLVDGGVHDNQGITGCMEQNCDRMIISDACGQLDFAAIAVRLFFRTPFRTNSILMERVRCSQFGELDAHKESGFLKNLEFMHLKMGLNGKPIDWIVCQDPSREQNGGADSTDYGIPKSIQEKLADLRTDLDSFSENEAFEIMTSGYLMAGKEIAPAFKIDPGSTCGGIWKFLKIRQLFNDAEKRKALGNELHVGKRSVFRWFFRLF